MGVPAKGAEFTSGVADWGCRVQEGEARDRDEIRGESFEKERVCPSKPLLIGRGVAHWPLHELVSDRAALGEKLAGKNFRVRGVPVMELKWREKLWPEALPPQQPVQIDEEVSFEALLARAAENEFAFCYATDFDEASNLAPLRYAIGSTPIVTQRPPRHYRPLRAFLHGRSYTDWHYHPNDETLMCQFGRRKTVYLLPPTQPVWDVLMEVARDKPYIGLGRPDSFPRLQALEPMRVTVNPGDALYIPPHWWHAVECSGDSAGLGMTLALCWGSPQLVRLDPRFPHQRLRFSLGPARKRIKLGIGAGAWAALRLFA
ncbi:MAG: cupin-like domain-containing protein [Pseudomonadota bacterium]